MMRDVRRMKAANDRQLVVVDVENALGFAPKHRQDVEDVKRRIEGAITIDPLDLVVIGVSHFGMLSSGLGWRGARLVVKSGADGADLALLEVLDEDVEQRFAKIVVVSGDHIFAEAVAALAGEGVATAVVARPGALSRRL